MRIVDIVLASVLLGLAIGYLNMGSPDTASAGAGNAQVAVSDSTRVNERLTWLRTPAMRTPVR
jgi:hypothetical protein